MSDTVRRLGCESCGGHDRCRCDEMRQCRCGNDYLPEDLRYPDDDDGRCQECIDAADEEELDIDEDSLMELNRDIEDMDQIVESCERVVDEGSKP